MATASKEPSIGAGIGPAARPSDPSRSERRRGAVLPPDSQGPASRLPRGVGCQTWDKIWGRHLEMEGGSVKLVFKGKRYGKICGKIMKIPYQWGFNMFEWENHWDVLGEIEKRKPCLVRLPIIICLVVEPAARKICSPLGIIIPFKLCLESEICQHMSTHQPVLVVW